MWVAGYGSKATKLSDHASPTTPSCTSTEMMTLIIFRRRSRPFSYHRKETNTYKHAYNKQTYIHTYTHTNYSFRVMADDVSPLPSYASHCVAVRCIVFPAKHCSPSEMVPSSQRL